MATNLKNLSQFDTPTPDAKGMRIGIVVAEWNSQVTGALRDGAVAFLREAGCAEQDIIVRTVPGTFELTLGAQLLVENCNVDAVIVLGCVIQGETPHFTFVCSSVTQGMTDLTIKWNKPMIFGVLTTNTAQQALDRAGGKHGNKGEEAAFTAVKMVAFKREITL